MDDPVQHLVNRLLIEGEKTANFFLDLPEHDLERVIYAGGDEWNVKQILMHIVSTEDHIYYLLQNIYQGGTGVPQKFDIDTFNQAQIKAMEFSSVEELTASFLEKRKKITEFVGKLGMTDLKKEGRHPFLGNAPIEEIIKLLYRHDQLHVRDVKRAIGKVR